MAKPKFRYGCFEAHAADEGPGVKYLVTDKDGTYVGVIARSVPEDERAHAELVERFNTRKQVKRLSHELRRAVKRDMVKQHGDIVKAEGVVEAMKMLGISETPPAPKPAPRPKPPQPKTTRPKLTKKTTKKTEPGQPADE
jgi:hypothetical protein